jgi:hypothetical protein
MRVENTILLGKRSGSDGTRRLSSERWKWILDVSAVVFLTLTTVLIQVQKLGISDTERLDYIERVQLARHNAVLKGTAPNPWSYRLLSEYISEAFVRAASAIQLPRPVTVGFLSFRILQNLFIFSAALLFYRRIGLTARQSLIGIVLLSYSISHAWYDSDLSFNTYGDICFYLLAACLVLMNRHVWLLPVSFFAALNRETSLFIPSLLIAALVGSGFKAWRSWVPQISLAVTCFVLQCATLLILRILIHPSHSWPWGNVPGWQTLWLNLTSIRTLLLLGLTISILPLATLWNFGSLPAWLKGVFWMMVPVWFIVHLSLAFADETRYFLVPIALVFIPGAMYSREH